MFDRLRDLVESNEIIQLIWIPGPLNLADALTKIKTHAFKYLNQSMTEGFIPESLQSFSSLPNYDVRTPSVWSTELPVLSIDRSLLMYTLFSTTLFAMSLTLLRALVNEIMTGTFPLSITSRAY